MRKRSKILNGPADTCPSYLRARIRFIENELREHPDKDSKDYKLLKYGVIPDEDGHLADICAEITHGDFKNYPPLSFMELTRYNTWFALHPEKVCGKEVVTTSRNFPLTIKGSKEAIIQTIHKFTRASGAPDKKLRLLKLKAKALMLKLKLEQTQY